VLVFFANSQQRSMVQIYSIALRRILTSSLVAFLIILMGSAVQAQQTTQPPCENITSPGTIVGEQHIQLGQAPDPLLEAVPAEGGTGDIRYQWMVYRQFGKMEGQWYPVLGANEATYQPGPLSKTTRYMRCASRTGCNTYLSSNEVTIQVAAMPL
jgi:hypothetical protein